MADRATFTILIGSIGRPTLKHALDSIARQGLIPGDQVLVGIDSFEQGNRPDVHRLVESYGPDFVAMSYDSGYHWCGIEQINYLMRSVPMSGSHVLTIGDDDVFTDGAFSMLRPVCEAHPLCPILYRFLSPWRELLWDEPRLEVGRISGCCIAAPREYVGPFPTRQYAEHDYDWIVDIVRRGRRGPLWIDEVHVIARPQKYGDDVTHRRLAIGSDRKTWQFGEVMEHARA